MQGRTRGCLSQEEETGVLRSTSNTSRFKSHKNARVIPDSHQLHGDKALVMPGHQHWGGGVEWGSEWVLLGAVCYQYLWHYPIIQRPAGENKEAFLIKRSLIFPLRKHPLQVDSTQMDHVVSFYVMPLVSRPRQSPGLRSLVHSRGDPQVGSALCKHVPLQLCGCHRLSVRAVS